MNGPGLREVEPDAWDALLAAVGVEDAYLRRGAVEASCSPGARARRCSSPSGDEVFLPALVREISGRTGSATSRRRIRTAARSPRRATRRRRLLGRVRGVVSRALGRLDVHPLPSAAAKTSATRRRRRSWSASRTQPSGGSRAISSPGCTAATATSAARRRRRASRSRSSARRRRSTGSSSCTRRRCGARARRTSTAFGRDYWETLSAGLGDGFVRLDATLDGELVASEVCVGGGPWIHYHMGVTSDRGPRARRGEPARLRDRRVGAGERLRGAEPRRRPRRPGGLAVGVQAPVRGRDGPRVLDRQARGRRGRVSRARRRSGGRTGTSRPIARRAAAARSPRAGRASGRSAAAISSGSKMPSSVTYWSIDFGGVTSKISSSPASAPQASSASWAESYGASLNVSNATTTGTSALFAASASAAVPTLLTSEPSAKTVSAPSSSRSAVATACAASSSATRSTASPSAASSVRERPSFLDRARTRCRRRDRARRAGAPRGRSRTPSGS